MSWRRPCVSSKMHSWQVDSGQELQFDFITSIFSSRASTLGICVCVMHFDFFIWIQIWNHWFRLNLLICCIEGSPGIYWYSPQVLLVSVCVYQYSIWVAAMSSCVQSTKYASQILTSQLVPSDAPYDRKMQTCKVDKSFKRWLAKSAAKVSGEEPKNNWRIDQILAYLYKFRLMVRCHFMTCSFFSSCLVSPTSARVSWS